MSSHAEEYRIVLGELYPLPICDVSLLGPKGRVEVRALVDSGATFSVFPESAAKDAGIQLPVWPNFPIQYGSGVEKGRKIEVVLTMFEMRLRADVVFVERLPYRFALVGRICVFSKFKEVSFLEQAKPQLRFCW